jgi:hypothetical protein
MNGALFLQKRGKRHMARTLEQFETLVAPHLTGEASRDGDRFKAIVRDSIKELVNEGSDIIDALAEGQEINGVAVALKDRIGASTR